MAKNTKKRQARRCPSLLNRDGDAHKGRKRLTQKKNPNRLQQEKAPLKSIVPFAFQTLSSTAGLIFEV